MQPSDIRAVVDHYSEASENTRLSSPAGQLEFQRTMVLLRQFLPPPPATILDVGGASGVYSLPLAAEGYTVHLIDPVPKHVQQAKAASAEAQHPLASAEVGDARKLSQESNSAEAVLLMGPLYHLTREDDRIAALTESFRVLKPGGVLFAVAISRFASTLDGLSRNLLADPLFVSIVKDDLKTGQHKNPTDNPNYFTDAFFHLPAELSMEATRAGFLIEGLEGIEGPGWLLSDLTDWMSDSKRHDQLMSLLEQLSSHESLVGASAHMMLIGRKRIINPVSLPLQTCELRNLQLEDAASLVENANDKEIASRLRDGFPHPYTMDDAHWWIAHANAQEPATHFAIAVDGQAVGGIGLLLQQDVARKSAEIGYWLGRKYWGRGIVTEAVEAFTNYAFEEFDLNRVYALAFEGNAASARVLEKAGFQYEGLLRKAVFKHGQLLDQLAYAKIRS